MTAFNVVRFRVKAGRNRDFLEAHGRIIGEWPGVRRVSMIQVGDQTYCLIAEWPDIETLSKARPQMIETLNSFRECLDDVGDGKGVTDAVSGDVVLELNA